MEAEFKSMENTLKLLNSKVSKLKEQQEITKNYLTTSINNLQITNENLQKMEIFMADAHGNPNFINQIITHFEKEQEQGYSKYGVEKLIQSSLPFILPNLRLLAKKPNLSFVYKLFDMVSDSKTNSIMLWSVSGTSFFIKDAEGLQNYVKEIFNHEMKTFYNTLGEFGFQCEDKFLREYTNENFQRDKKHMLKDMKSKRKLWAVKKNMQNDMEEELKRLKFFLDAIKVNIIKISENEKTTKRDLRHLNMCLEFASKRITQKKMGQKRTDLPHVGCQFQTDESTMPKQNQPIFMEIREAKRLEKREPKRRPWLDQIDVDTRKLEQDMYKLNVQIQNLEQGQVFIEDQLAAIEKILPGIEIKQQDIKSYMNKLFKNPIAFPKKRSRENKNKKICEKGNKKTRDQTMQKDDNTTNQEHMFTTEWTNQELMMLIGLSEYEPTFS